MKMYISRKKLGGWGEGLERICYEAEKTQEFLPGLVLRLRLRCKPEKTINQKGIGTDPPEYCKCGKVSV